MFKLVQFIAIASPAIVFAGLTKMKRDLEIHGDSDCVFQAIFRSIFIASKLCRYSRKTLDFQEQ